MGRAWGSSPHHRRPGRCAPRRRHRASGRAGKGAGLISRARHLSAPAGGPGGICRARCPLQAVPCADTQPQSLRAAAPVILAGFGWSPTPGLPVWCLRLCGTNTSVIQQPGQGAWKATRPSWLWGEDAEEPGSGPRAGWRDRQRRDLGSESWLCRAPALWPCPGGCVHPAFPALVSPSVNGAQSTSPRRLAGFRERRDTKSWKAFNKYQFSSVLGLRG